MLWYIRIRFSYLLTSSSLGIDGFVSAYRTHQVMQTIAHESTSFFLAVLLSFYTIFAVLTITIFIKFLFLISPIIIIAYAAFGAVMLSSMFYVVLLASRSRNASCKRLHEVRAMQLTGYQKRFVKSCKPIEAAVSFFFSIESVFFLEILSFVTTNIVNLLVFRN